MNGNTFYDIHMHAFNLNYQYIRAYLTRLDLLVIAAGAFFTIGRLGLPAIPLMHFFGKKLKKARNMLALMENDLGEFFLQTEYCLKRDYTWGLEDGLLHIGQKPYDKIVFTPLMMDFVIADLELRERQRELENKYRTADAEEEKKALEAQLEVVVSDRYDLIVRQKQMEYEQLLKRLEALQKEVKASLKEIETWLDKGFKEKTVKDRMEDLTTKERRRGPFG